MLASLQNFRAPSDGEEDDSQSSSSNSPAHADYEESDFFEGNNDSQSSIGVPTLENMAFADEAQRCNIYPPIDRLPAEILINIFSKLGMPSDVYHCMQVSKKWARNAVDLLWHRPSCLNIAKHTIICSALASGAPYFTYHDMIKRLNLAALSELVNDGSVVALAVCTRVERLTLTNCKGLTDSGITGLIQGNSNLLALDASSVNEITDSTMLALASNCKRLQGLNISGCKKVSSDALITVADSCRSIKRIKLNECSQLTDSAILALATCCRNILEIDLQSCKKIEDEPITALLTCGRSLRELRLPGCELISDHAFLSLPMQRTYEHLRILDLTSCIKLTDRAVEKIIEVAPRLRNLVLAKCKNITDVAVNAISRLGKFLHYVHLGHCGNITDASVTKLVKSCNRIRYIDLGCCMHLTDASIMQLATLPKLRRIGLVKCSLITDESVFALANAHRTRRAAAELARHPHLKDHIDGRPSHHTNSLERVHLSYCINLTLKSILVLLNNCPKLTHLSLTGVHSFINRDDLDPFCREAPPEFTDHQRQVFCVFSGTGVIGLRKYLNEQESERLRTAGEDGGDEASADDEDDDDETVDGDEDLDATISHAQLTAPAHASTQTQTHAAVITGNQQGPILPQQHTQTQPLVQPHTAVLHDPGIDPMTDVVGEMVIDTDPETGEPDDDNDRDMV